MIINKEKLLSELWTNGNIEYLFTPTKEQKEMIDFIEGCPPSSIVYIECVRAFGKTITLMHYLLSRSLKKKLKILYIGNIKDQVEELIDLHLEPFISEAPNEIKPKRLKSKYRYTMHNDGFIKFFGADKDKFKGRRGPQYDIVYIDEISSIDNCYSMIYSIIYPMVERRGGKIICTTTPSQNSGHDSTLVRKSCEAKGRFFRRNVYECELYTPQRINKIKEELGETSDAWRVEYLLEDLPNKARQAIPEFSKQLHVVDSFKLPEYFDRYILADFGFTDNTHVLWCYWDFDRSKLVFYKELFINNITTSKFASLFHPLEKECGTINGVFINNSGMYSDNAPQELYDLSVDHNINFTPKREYDWLVSVNRARVFFSSGKIEIFSGCENLVKQLQYGVRKKNKEDWERIEGLGHLDGIDAIRHGLPMIDFNRNPYPENYGVNVERRLFLDPKYQEVKTNSWDNLSDV